MRHPDANRLYQHWHDLCQGPVVPDRADIEPAQIGAALRDVFILGNDNVDGWRFRVSGTRLTSLLGREPRDLELKALFDEADAQQIESILLTLSEDSLPVVAGISAQTKDGDVLEFEALLLPLRHGQSEPTRALGGIFPTIETASRLHLQINKFSIISTRTIDFTRDVEVNFGVSKQDPDAAMIRRRGFRIIEGGRSSTPVTNGLTKNSGI